MVKIEHLNFSTKIIVAKSEKHKMVTKIRQEQFCYEKLTMNFFVGWRLGLVGRGQGILMAIFCHLGQNFSRILGIHSSYFIQIVYNKKFQSCTRHNESVFVAGLSWPDRFVKTFLSPASEASKEVANLSERKNLHTPVYGVKEFICLSLCLSLMNFDLNYLQTG